SLNKELVINHVKDSLPKISVENLNLRYLAYYRPLKNGRLKKKVSKLPFSFVLEYRIFGEEGKIYNPKAYYEKYIDFVIVGDDENSLLNHLHEVNRYIDENTIWEPIC
ncbi:hypothetical protein, partial [Paraburkholderia sp. BR14264]|uniref:hypothetical protein n=1 Tax=Paraburkholderia sp. BR14264 TaxID=3237001 RepID=UPI003977F69D